MPRALAIVPLLLATLGGAAAQKPPPPSPEARAVEALPPVLGAFRRGGAVMDYERQPGGAGYGASVRYLPANGERMLVTVYLYDGGRPRGPDGARGGDLFRELASAAGELDETVRRGRYRAVEPRGGMSVGEGTDGGVRCNLFRIVQPDGRTTGDSVCMAIHDGRFVKVRVTAEDPPGETGAGLIGADLVSRVRNARAAGTAPR